MPSAFLYCNTEQTGLTDPIFPQAGTPVLVGDPGNLWSDSDDGTYTQCVGESKAPFDAGFTYRSDRVEGELGALDAGITPTAIIVHLRTALFETSHPAGGEDLDHAFLYIRTSDFSINFNLIDDDVNSWGNTSIADYAINLADPIPNTGGLSHYDWNSVTMEDLAGAFKTADVRLRCFIPNYTGGPESYPSGIYYDRFRIYEWYIEVQYGATTKPILRVHPREDGRGSSSADRVYPPPRSRQASNRTVSGYL